MDQREQRSPDEAKGGIRDHAAHASLGANQRELRKR